MKKVFAIALIFLIAFSLNSFAQSGMWTYMHGDSASNSAGNFGTQGVAAPANNPPGLYEPCEWIDHNGNFWLFGGSYYYNALWKFDVTIGQWIWINGSNSSGQTGSYGTQGVPSPTNHPGCRLASTSWVDNNGNLWMYGGVSPTYGLSDLWKFDVVTNEWTWMDGSSTGNVLAVYGTKGVANPTNDPGSRLETAAAWVDDSNQLWFFGGQLCCTAFGYIDDVWKYNIASSEWTWVQGSNTSGALPVYGSKGIPDVANTPGGRRIYSHWKDADDNFWIFGGQDNSGNVTNDLWKYNPVINEWTWMHGANTVNSNGQYGTLCVFDSLNDPPARMENRFCWTDSCYNFWMFGGLNTFSGAYRNDLWCYSPSINEWKWTAGSSQQNKKGSYGTIGIPSAANHPGSRYGGVSWLGTNENLWLFGGTGYPYDNNVGTLNDLWRFTPDTTCVSCKIIYLPNAAFKSSDSSVCEKFCVDFSDQSTNNPTAWQWIFEGGDPASSANQNPTQICYNTPGTYDVTLITTNAFGTDTTLLANFITVFSTPLTPVITVNGNILTCSSASSYQWQFNAVDIPGATNQSYTVTQPGLYTVIVGDENGCVNSASVSVDMTGIGESESENGISIYPNPSNGKFFIGFRNDLSGKEISIEVINTIGQNVFSSVENFSSPFSTEISLENSPDGVYFLEIKSENIFLKKKIIISK